MGNDPLADAVRLAQAGRFSEATQICEQVLRLHPTHAAALTLAGAIALRSGDVAAALKRLNSAVAIDTKSAAAQANLGDALSAAGRTQEAIAAFRRAIALEPRFFTAHAGLGLALQAQGDAQGALAAFERAAALDRHSAPLQVNLGAILHALGRYDEALAALARARSLAPGHPEPLYNTGVVLQAKGDLAGAERAYREAIAAAPQHVGALHNLGFVLAARGQPAAALPFYDRALALAPGFAEAAFNRANALKDLGRFSEAIAGYDRVLAQMPDHRAAAESRGLAYLTLGEFGAGWRDYLTRAVPRERTKRPTMPWPADLAGRTVFLRCEQGLGDELFFLRFAPLLTRRGARVVSEADPRLLSIARRHPGVDDVVARDSPPAAHNLETFQGDVPFLLSSASATDAPPASVAPDPARLGLWQEKLAAAGPGPYTAVSWRAGVLKDGRFTKTAPVKALGAALASLPGTMIVVQRALLPDEMDEFRAGLGRPCADYTAANGDLEDMLALMALVDRYVAVSNTNVHLRAAAGRSSHVLVPFPPEWRWRDEGAQSPWYPGTRLYRQDADGRWDASLAALARDLCS